jgi:predicted methyltransferase
VKKHLLAIRWIVTGLFSAALVAVCAGASGETTNALPDYHALVQSSDRSDTDRKADERRKPEQLLAFSGVKTGMKVLDLGAGGGYSTELLARAVGPLGVVYAQNARAREPFDERMKNPVMKNVVPAIRAYDDPVPPEAKHLDLVTVFLVYHDITFMPVDRAKMNKALFAALKPGGHLVVIDHSAKTGAGATVGKSLHRIEEATLRQEVEAAGFKLEAEDNFLRDLNDSRDVPFREMSNMLTDRFALKFVRP